MITHPPEPPDVPSVTVGTVTNLQSGMTAEKSDWLTRLAQTLQQEFSETEQKPDKNVTTWIAEQLKIIGEMKSLGLEEIDVATFLSGITGISDIYRETFIALCKLQIVQEGTMKRVQGITLSNQRSYSCPRIDETLRQLEAARRAEQARANLLKV